MGVRRVVLLVLVAALMAVAAIVGTTDVRAGAANCGSALLPAAERPVVRSGDDLDDDFARQSVEADCGRALTGRRLLVALPAGAATLAGWAARRDRKRSESPAARSVGHPSR